MEPREHGPLPPLLIVLTVVTGLVDSVSYLALGQVFVANMTGNIIFLGFGLVSAGHIRATTSCWRSSRSPSAPPSAAGPPPATLPTAASCSRA